VPHSQNGDDPLPLRDEFLGVNAPGALVSFGDGHYAMGEGEIMGAAIEGAMHVEVWVDIIRKSATPIPRIENADEVMFVGSGRPLIASSNGRDLRLLNQVLAMCCRIL